ncbi:MAG: prolipoprotein diacylglyceryl transferase [Clostridia bacterium]|nr:prolipoprotein diacylglyceryl transferase [Clostridia bacterium]
MKEYFNFLGFKINTKKFMISLGVFAFVVLVLLIVDMLFLEVSWYGFLTGLAFLLAVVISSELMPERGLKKDFSYDLIWWIFPLSIIGARVAFVVNNIHLFDSFWEMCAIWNGGQSIYGGVIGGIVGLVICCLIKKQNPICAMDCVAPVLILGQAIGRWGNFINMEVYGWEITNKALQWFPFGVKVNGTWHLATFFYESVLDFAGFFLLLFLLRKTNKKGVVTLTWFAYYGFIRFFLEQLREEKYIMYIPGTNLQWSTITSIIMFSIGAIGLIAILVKSIIDKKKGLSLETSVSYAAEKTEQSKPETEVKENDLTEVENKVETKNKKSTKQNVESKSKITKK